MFIKCAKTDPFQCGCFICLFGCFSLFSELTSYLHLHGPGIGPLFIFQDGRPLLRALLPLVLQSTLQAAGIPSKFSGHSFRIGAATTAPQRGVPDHLIKTTSCWLSEVYLFCAHPWMPSFQQLVEYPTTMILSLTNGVQWLGGYPRALFCGALALPCHEPHSIQAGCCFAWSFSGMAWGLMAGLPGFASHGSSLHLHCRSWLPIVEAPGRFRLQSPF